MSTKQSSRTQAIKTVKGDLVRGGSRWDQEFGPEDRVTVKMTGTEADAVLD